MEALSSSVWGNRSLIQDTGKHVGHHDGCFLTNIVQEYFHHAILSSKCSFCHVIHLLNDKYTIQKPNKLQCNQQNHVTLLPEIIIVLI